MKEVMTLRKDARGSAASDDRRQMAPPPELDSANQKPPSEAAEERCQLAFVNRGYEECDGCPRTAVEERVGVCFGAKDENSDCGSASSHCGDSSVAISIASEDCEQNRRHVSSREASWTCPVNIHLSPRPKGLGSPASFPRYAALRIPSSYGVGDPSLDYRSPHSRRLWFHRPWVNQVGIGQSRDQRHHNNAGDLREFGCWQEKQKAAVPAFPDVELGQDSTSLPSDDEECRLRNQSSAENDGAPKLSALNSRQVYSIGVFYSDTDQCREEQRSSSHCHLLPHNEKSPASPPSSSSRNGEEIPSVQPNEQVRKGTEPAADMARGTPGGDGLAPNRQTILGDTPGNSEHRDRRQGSHRSRHDRRIPTPQLTPDAFTPTDSGDSVTGPSDVLPDILNSHMPPPYSTLPHSGGRRLPPPSHPPPPPPPVCGNPGSVLPPCPHSTPRRSSRGRGTFRGFPPRDRMRSSGRRSNFAPAASESDEPKHCCGVMVTQTVSIRWFIVMIAFVGLCCAIVGTVLGALKATGREHLTVSLLMIGVGIVLITVSGIAWRLTSHDAPSCRAMLGLQTTEQEPNRRFVPRMPPYGRPHHPYAAMMYPEFQYRPPPPSYQASMQEYRLRLLLLDRHQGSGSNTPTALSPVSPPPTYRSHTTSTLHSRPPLMLNERDYSRPPSYRSRASSAGILRPSMENLASSRDPNGEVIPAAGVSSTSHSRNPSLSLSFLSHESLFVDSSHSRLPDSSGTAAATSDNTNPVHFTSPSGESQNSVVAGLSDDSSPLATDAPSHEHPVDMGRVAGSWRRRDHTGSVWALRKHHDINAVTIVQTTDSSQVLNQDTVILSISGHNLRTPEETAASGEVQILAHV